MTESKNHAFEIAARLVRFVTAAVVAVCGVLFCLALIGLSVEIVMRTVLGSSVRGMQEVVTLAFIYAFLLGTAALYSRNEDVALTIFVKATPARWHSFLALLVSTTMAITMAIVFVETIRLMDAQRSIVSLELGIPEPFRFAPLAAAAAMMACTSLIDAWGHAISALGGPRLAVWDKTSLSN